MILKILSSLLYLSKGHVITETWASNITTKHTEQWNDYISQEGLIFLNEDHHNHQYEVFRDNVDKINHHNSLNLTWQLGITSFAHLTDTEFKEHVLGGCTLNQKSDTSRLVHMDASKVADSVDWVAAGKVTKVKNQGQCGSCWAFSTTGAVESRYAINKGKLTSLSEQELVDCAGKEGNKGCKGGLMDFGFEYVEEMNGLCTEASYAYDAKTDKAECNQMRSKCGDRVDPIKGFADVPKNNETQLQAAVASGPVAVAIQANQFHFRFYRSGIMTGRCGTTLDHGVLAVGYGSENGVDFWKVKNSWGASWGEKGYFRLCRNCGKNEGAGQCGIASTASYPTF